MHKPYWLDKKINLSDIRRTKELLRGFKLSTVCEEAMCPNLGECFRKGVATFMILGNVCTRHCSFCATKKGKGKPWDIDEPIRIKQAAEKLRLSYAVVTSPTRDDLADYGVQAFCRTVEEIKKIKPATAVEILIPDFCAQESALKKISRCGADVVAHNLETVPSLYIKVRQGADYGRSLEVLRAVKKNNAEIKTKSGIMLGLGEREKEVMEVFKDLAGVNCDLLTLGQYLSPSRRHYPVREYINPAKFMEFQAKALSFGFKSVQSSPYSRSSYLAGEMCRP
jgi:lipoic acid synthetase